jgi:hypothetical protein
MDLITIDNIIVFLNLNLNENIHIKKQKYNLKICDSSDIERVVDINEISSIIYITIYFLKYSIVDYYDMFFTTNYFKYIKLLNTSKQITTNLRNKYDININTLLYETLEEFDVFVNLKINENKNSLNYKFYKSVDYILNPIYQVVKDLKTRYNVLEQLELQEDSTSESDSESSDLSENDISNDMSDSDCDDYDLSENNSTVKSSDKSNSWFFLW